MIKTIALLVITGIAFALYTQAGFVSLLIWVWLSVMMPQAEAYNPAILSYSNLIAGVVTVIFLISTKDKNPPAANGFTVLFFVLTVFIILSQIFSLNSDLSYSPFRVGITVLFMTYAVLALVNTKVKIQALLWVFVLSVGYYGVTRGLYTIANGGAGYITGPGGTLIADNNQLAVGLAMLVPLSYYLARTSVDKRARMLAIGISSLSIVAIIGTHSRGGLISLGVLVLGLISRSKNKLLNLIIFIIAIGGALPLMPASWFQRMDTISNAEQDSSFNGRVEAWEIAYKLALENPILGVGAHNQYYPAYNAHLGTPILRATHNAYLEILAGQGFLAFGAFLGMMTITLLWCSRIKKLTKNKNGFLWANDLAGMLQLSMLVYGVGVMALSMEFWLGLWLNMALVCNLRVIVLRELKLTSAATMRRAYA